MVAMLDQRIPAQKGTYAQNCPESFPAVPCVMERVTLTGAPETMLATLYARALDSRAAKSVLNDHTAADAVQRIDYDFRKTGINAATATGVALRGKLLDDWTREFLADNPEATVLHLACGLDTRAQRLNPGPTVRWYDIDYPDVMALRTKLLPTPDGEYHTITTSVTDQEWLAEIPADRPTVTVAEGLVMYLTPDQGRDLIQRIASRFPSGQLLFDVYGSAGIKMQRMVRAVRNANATLHWGVDDPREIESFHPGLRCLSAVRSVEMPGMEAVSRATRVAFAIMARIPKIRDVGQVLRYAY